MKRAYRSNGARLGTTPMLAAAVAVIVGVASLLSGCDVDSFMDPSEIGRWENTPVVLPIIERLDVIDEPVDEIPGVSEIRSEDLVPEIKQYVLHPGDVITVTVLDLFDLGSESVQTRRINETGHVRLPIIGQVKAAGLTAKQLEERIVDILHPAIVRDPTVTVTVQEARERTFSVIGTAGTSIYNILQTDFRLLDAIAMSGGLPSDAETIYVIRQVPLSDVVEEGYVPDPEEPGAHQPPPSGDDAGAAPGQAPPDGGDDEVLDPGALLEDLSEEGDGQQEEEPEEPENGSAEASPLGEALQPGGSGEGRFINVNGQWVWVEEGEAAARAPSGQQQVPEDAATAADLAGLPDPSELVTQRVIRIDAEALQRGEARYNIVVRPGDVIRVPPPTTGNIYIDGHVGRPGTFSLPRTGDLTLRQAIIAAGGLAPTAIPERVDLTRRIGEKQQATVRLNLRAIAEGVQPDIFVKPEDTIVVGTNVWASHAAVIRNSFRFSYGFGFLLDRNFGSDVFGAPPRNRGVN